VRQAGLLVKDSCCDLLAEARSGQVELEAKGNLNMWWRGGAQVKEPIVVVYSSQVRSGGVRWGHWEITRHGEVWEQQDANTTMVERVSCLAQLCLVCSYSLM
jgi:hypothetical protein